jgi:preprotein translocase subunit SecY
MGIGPYINASIIVQLLAVALPPLERLSKQGEEGRKKIAAITRYITIGLAVLQSIGILVSYGALATGGSTGDIPTLSAIIAGGYENAQGNKFVNFLSYVIIVLFYTAGTCMTMWIGERITDYGVSNGISMLIFVGIIATAGQYIIGMLQGTNDTTLWVIIAFCVVAVLIFAAIVTVDSAERKV